MSPQEHEDKDFFSSPDGKIEMTRRDADETSGHRSMNSEALSAAPWPSGG
jgi:hypothetical protein